MSEKGKSMRVVHVYKDYYPVVGGIENYVRLLTTRLRAAHEIDARVLVTSPTLQAEHAIIDGVPVYRASRLATVASTPLSVQMAGMLHALKPDLVHLHFPYPIGELSYLLACPTVPAVVTYHSDIVRQKKLLMVYRPLLKRLLRHAAAIQVTSPHYLESSTWLQPHRDRCHIISSGIAMNEWQAAVADATSAAIPLRRHLLRDGQYQHLVLFVGRFRYYKGLHVLLQAWPRVANARLVLVGSGPEEARLRAQVADLGIGESVVFASDVGDEELPAYHAAADVFVLPSCLRSEALGLVLVEAEAAGVPCISTDLGTGTSWINLDGTTGRVVPPNAPSALAAAVNDLLADPTLRRAMGEAARARARELCDIDGIARQVAALYRQVLSERA